MKPTKFAIKNIIPVNKINKTLYLDLSLMRSSKKPMIPDKITDISNTNISFENRGKAKINKIEVKE